MDEGALSIIVDHSDIKHDLVLTEDERQRNVTQDPTFQGVLQVIS